MGFLRKAQPPVEVQLSERDARILTKYEHRAKQFDEMIKICCCWIGYDVLLDLIPIVGKVISLGFSLSMYRLACQCQLPGSLRRTMLYHITVDFLGLIPILGIILTMLYRANTKNARLLRRFLYKRASQQQQQTSPPPPPSSSAAQTPMNEIQQPQPVLAHGSSFVSSTAGASPPPPPLPTRELSYSSANPPPTPPRGDSS
ncbi:hypothetical protein BDB00DRAFT_467046 [Zychaea mexicana]|uniref:uncharacterized protein n=1 Tax=Zychaea mexicana TaxID=64656 RepID=UPI0022FEAFBB|nr:uncharacterized protein BDB00DRAFT_467046 [Zychaea mexicana]KAI9491838.1 hypothetical protein BDB00DRAFT_467046 [Zychaea mexicana]